jgi:multiple sugar transport system permease protein
MIPFPAIMIPTYFIFKHLGWIGTLKPLWVPACFGNAFNIFLLRQFFLQIPNELSEAARLDGLTHWGIFWRIVMPLSKPALLVVALFHAMYVWNDFIGPLIYLNHQDLFTLALGLQFYQAQHGGTPWNLLMAACTLVTGPLLIVFLIAQRSFVEGIATTGMKG